MKYLYIAFFTLLLCGSVFAETITIDALHFLTPTDYMPNLQTLELIIICVFFVILTFITLFFIFLPLISKLTKIPIRKPFFFGYLEEARNKGDVQDWLLMTVGILFTFVFIILVANIFLFILYIMGI